MNQGIPNPQYPWDYTPMDHLKVAAGQLSRVIPPVRYGERVLFTGPQGDDASIIFGAAPTGFKRPDIVGSIAQSRARLERRSPWRRLGEVAFPFLPRPSEDPRIAAQRASKIREARGRSSGPKDRRLRRLYRHMPSPGAGSDPRLERVYRGLK